LNRRISVDEKKKGEILTLEILHNKKALRCFMGIVKYNTRFIPRLVEIAAPLTALCGNEP
jgi:hypothetical protein